MTTHQTVKDNRKGSSQNAEERLNFNSMYEVELKLRSEHEPVRDRLAAIGATPTERVAQTDTYYSVPHRDFESTDESLRIRREEFLDQSDESIAAHITYKGPLIEQESKTRREEETAVEDSETIQSILEALGFTPLTAVKKERERFIYQDYTIVLDMVDGLGEFVEIERDASDEDIENARDGARDVLRELNLDPNEHVRTAYLDLQLSAIDDEE